jgi:hypothetical protein
MECFEFVRQFEIQYPNVIWIDVQTKINGVIRQVFDVVTRFVMIIRFYSIYFYSHQPPNGMAANEQSRAMYGIDMMLKWSDGMCHIIIR